MIWRKLAPHACGLPFLFQENEETTDNVDNDDFIAIRRPRREIKKPE